MAPRNLTALVLVGLVAGAAVAGPVSAAPKKKPKPKPITKTYEVTAFPPDPTPVTGQTGGNCQPTIPQAAHVTPFKAPAAGTLEIWLTNFQGDWALGLRNKSGQNLADSDQDVTAGEDLNRPEHIKWKIKTPTTVQIAACNFLGAPTATVKYVFTFA